LHLEWTGPAPRATADVAAPLIVEPSTRRLPDEMKGDHEALFRAFLEYTKRATPDIRQQGRAARSNAGGIAARDHRVGSQAAAPDRGAVRPAQPLARHAEGQKAAAPKNLPQRASQDRQSLFSPWWR
jgi:hypothetical protein